MNAAIKCLIVAVSVCAPLSAYADEFEPIKQLLKDPYSAKFSALPPRSDGTICGLVNAKNSYGGYVGQRPFAILADGQAYIVNENNTDRYDYDCLGGKEKYAAQQRSEVSGQDEKCPDSGEMAFSCRVSGGKELMLCKVPGGVFYSFGPRARPELTLSRLKRDVSYISELMGGKSSRRTVLTNGDYKYEVFGGYTQGVNVSRNGNSLGYFACNPDSVYDRMETLNPSANN